MCFCFGCHLNVYNMPSTSKPLRVYPLQFAVRVDRVVIVVPLRPMGNAKAIFYNNVDVFPSPFTLLTSPPPQAATATQIKVCTKGDDSDCAISKANEFPIIMCVAALLRKVSGSQRRTNHPPLSLRVLVPVCTGTGCALQDAALDAASFHPLH